MSLLLGLPVPSLVDARTIASDSSEVMVDVSVLNTTELNVAVECKGLDTNVNCTKWLDCASQLHSNLVLQHSIILKYFFCKEQLLSI